jgi:hypothetical protein
VSSGSLITLYRETNGKTRGQLSGVPLSIVSSHPSTNNTNGLTVNDDSGEKTSNAVVQNIFYRISDKNRTLRIVGNISFNTFVTNYDDVNYSYLDLVSQHIKRINLYLEKK